MAAYSSSDLALALLSSTSSVANSASCTRRAHTLRSLVMQRAYPFADRKERVQVLTLGEIIERIAGLTSTATATTATAAAAIIHSGAITLCTWCSHYSAAHAHVFIAQTRSPARHSSSSMTTRRRSCPASKARTRASVARARAIVACASVIAYRPSSRCTAHACAKRLSAEREHRTKDGMSSLP